MSEIGSLLGRWHQWRARYRAERGYSTVRFGQRAEHTDEDEEFEHIVMTSMEDTISGMSREHQIALQHLARAECLGVEVIFLNSLPSNRDARDSLCLQALRELERRLVRSGII